VIERRIQLDTVLHDLGDSIIRVIGPRDRIISYPAPINEAPNELAITFCRRTGQEGAGLIRDTKAGVIICKDEAALKELAAGKTLVAVADPRLTFIRLVQRLFAEPRPQGIHPTAMIEPGAKIDPTAYVGPFTYVGKSEIGERTVIHGHAHIYSKVRIGRNVTIHAGAVLGADGFGYQRNEIGELEKFPHVGGILIEDDVEIGANTCIDRGTLGDTIIRQGAKISKLVHVAHNVVVGRHSTVMSHAMVCGSTRIADYAWISPSACIRDEISVGAHSVVGLGAVVVKNVPDDATVMGVPARPLDEYKRVLHVLRGLQANSDS
jgi:UDP-3-O-[3-hydroxymyristoyl] glucosamine N-acyltransferase